MEIIQEGEGTETVPDDARVTCHYVGYIDGRKFDSTYEEGRDPIEFIKGKHQVIKGWEDAISNMKKGEKARVTCPPKVAYGSNGAGALIPPNSTLVFEIEVL